MAVECKKDILKVSIEFNGYDQMGKYRNDDETSSARIKLENYVNGEYDTK